MARLSPVAGSPRRTRFARVTTLATVDPCRRSCGFADTDSSDDPDPWTLTATIVTSDSVKTLTGIHDCNPVILPEDLRMHWTDPTVTGGQALVDEAVRAGFTEAEQLRIDQVRPFTAKDDGPELLAQTGRASARCGSGELTSVEARARVGGSDQWPEDLVDVGHFVAVAKVVEDGCGCRVAP